MSLRHRSTERHTLVMQNYKANVALSSLPLDSEGPFWSASRLYITGFILLALRCVVEAYTPHPRRQPSPIVQSQEPCACIVSTLEMYCV